MRSLTAQDIMFRAPSGNTVKTDVSRGVTKKPGDSKESFFGKCTGLGSLCNLPQALQGSKAGGQTWENLKNTAQNQSFRRFHPRQFSTCPSFFQEKPRFPEDLSSELFF